MPLKAPELFERDGKFYLVGKIAPTTPDTKAVEEYAFGTGVVSDVRSQAPNANLAWYKGHYVESDTANKNGALWGAKELAIKSLTPQLMPVTVMHDPATAVGLIADTKLLTPEKDNVQRAKIDTVLALWKHRFPQVAEEAAHNFEQGTLMQSMECISPEYSCTECGQVHHKLPDNAERADWCEHLMSETAARELHDFTFTGTGLIFGSRGAEGADPSANLVAFGDEVAYLHERARHDAGRKTPPKRRKNIMEIDDKKYEELVADATKGKSLDAVQSELAETKTKLAAAETNLATVEAAKVTAESEVATLKTKVSEFEEKAQEGTLRQQRLDGLGSAFTAKLGDLTKARLQERAGALSDEDWSAELAVLEEALGVKHDAKADGDGAPADAGSADGGKTPAELASFQGGRSGGPAAPPSPRDRASAYAGL